jgi:hypothetical protein
MKETPRRIMATSSFNKISVNPLGKRVGIISFLYGGDEGW